MTKAKPFIYRWWGMLLLLTPMLGLLALVGLSAYAICHHGGPLGSAGPDAEPAVVPTPTEPASVVLFDEVMVPEGADADDDAEVIVARFHDADGMPFIGAFDSSDLDERWRVGPLAQRADEARLVSFAVVRDSVTIMDAQKALRIVDLDDGEEHSVAPQLAPSVKLPSTAPGRCVPAVTSGPRASCVDDPAHHTRYVVRQGGGLAAVDTQSGAVRWSVTRPRTLISVAASAEQVYVVDEAHTLIVLNASDGLVAPDQQEQQEQDDDEAAD